MISRAEFTALQQQRDSLKGQAAAKQLAIDNAIGSGVDDVTVLTLIEEKKQLNLQVDDAKNAVIKAAAGGISETAAPVAPAVAAPINADPTAPNANTKVSNTGENASNDDRKSVETSSTVAPTAPKTKTSFVSAIGFRPNNPLSSFSSYTYHLTLFMVSPEAYIKFVNDGATQIANEGFYVVAESGGTSPNAVTPRLFPDRDYFIDDLVFKTSSNTKATDGPVNSMGFEFKIYEPYGFSFTSQLKAAAAKIDAASKLPNADKNFNPLKHFFVLGFKFFGYDDEGEYLLYDTVSEELGRPLTGNHTAAAGGNFPRYFPLNITDFSFKLDGKTTVYSIKMQPVAIQEAFGVKRSQFQSTYQLIGTTVADVLLGQSQGSSNNSITGILDILNKKEQDLVNSKQAGVANVYEIYIDPEIGNKKLVTAELKNKNKSAMYGVNGSDGTSAKESLNNTKYDPNTRSVTVNSGQSLIKLIDNIICQSEYILGAMEYIYNEELVTKSKPQTEKYLQWFMINPVAIPLGYDTIRNDYSYRLIYEIKPYQIPFVRSTFVNVDKKTKYSGAYKKYEYYFTGQNTEVLSFETTYNNLYFIPGGSDGSAMPSRSGTDVPVVPGSKITGNESQLGKAGDPVGSVKTSLYSLADSVKNKLLIMGDPDYLMTRIGVAGNVTAPKEAVYGPDYSINPLIGQIFIEINFYEGVDYDTQTGLLKINKNIEFYQYPKTIKDKISGIVYMVLSVVSTFSKGKFTQELDLALWPAPPDEVTNTVTGREFSENDQSKQRVVSTGVANNAFLAGVPKAQTVGFSAVTPISNFATDAVATTNSDILKTIAPTPMDQANRSVLAAINRVQNEGGREPPQTV